MKIVNETAELMLNQYDIPEEVVITMFDDELLTEYQCRKVIIRNKYLELSSKLKLTEIKEMLAEKYCLSLSTVEKYIAGI